MLENGLKEHRMATDMIRGTKLLVVVGCEFP